MASLVTQSEPNYINLQFVDSGFNNAQSYHSNNSDYISTESEPPDSENEPWKYWGDKLGDYGESFLEFKGRIMCNDEEITKEEVEEADKTSCYIDVPAQTAVAFNRLIRNIDSTTENDYDIDRYSKKVNVAIEACKIFYNPRSKDDTSEGDISEGDDDIDINWTNIDPPNGKSAEFFQFNNLGYEHPSRNLYFAHSDNLNHVNEEEVLKARKDNYEREYFKFQVMKNATNNDTLNLIRNEYTQVLQNIQKNYKEQIEGLNLALKNEEKKLENKYEAKYESALNKEIEQVKKDYYKREEAQKAMEKTRKKSRPTEEQFKIKLKF